MQHKLHGLIFVILLLFILFLAPWKTINWGKISFVPAETVTMTGEASSSVNNQVATFTAGVSQISDDKDAAVTKVNTIVEQLIRAVKDFGINEVDIKTQNIGIYQMEEQYFAEGIQKSRAGQWRVNNDIEIKLRDISKTSELTDLLSQSGATNVWGPNFSLNDVTDTQTDLLGKAIENARIKAEKAAKGSARTLGKILSVTEGTSTQNVGPFYAKDGMGGGGAPVEVGSTEIIQTVTVIFEMK